MFKQSSSRNQKPKGVKVKYILQICLLVAICFWLIYQVKHSHDKRKEFNAIENGEKASEKSNEDRLKLGRKDLPREEEDDEKVVDGENHNEEVEDEEEEKKPQIEEEQEGEIEVDEKKDDERGNGDDELDEFDQEKLEGEIDREEDIFGEERESENESLLEDQEEHEDENGKNTHEAREEHYKGDDASSEVAHDGNSLIDDPDNIVKSNNTHEMNDQNNSDPLLANDQQPGEEKSNETILLQSNDLSPNSLEMVKEKPGAPMQTSTETIFDSTQSQKTIEGDRMIKEGANSMEHDLSEKMMTSNKTSAANESSENSGIIQNENSGSSEETRIIDEEESNSDSSMVNESIDDSVQYDPIDSSDSVLQEERANRIDLDTLPDIKTEGIDNDDAAAE